MRYQLYIWAFIISQLTSCKESNKLKNSVQHSNHYYDLAFEYREKSLPDSAFLYFSKAKELFLQNGDRFSAGKCLVNMGIIATDRGDNFGGQELSLNAISYFDYRNKEHWTYLKSNYNNLGITSYQLKNFINAIEFYEKSLNLATDSEEVLIIRNNIANALRENKQYSRAIEIYRSILSQKLSDKELARVYSNFAYTKWRQNPSYNANQELLNALAIRLKINDVVGLNTSYMHLSDFNSKKYPNLAHQYAIKMLETSTISNNADDQLTALQKIIELGTPYYTKIYFQRYQQLNDSVQTTRNAAKNQFALIRYETEKHKAENLKLQKENTEKKYQLLLLVIAAVLITAAGVIWYRKRRQKLRLETEQAIKDNQLKTSKKVHDVVANGLYKIMSKLENQREMENETILNEMEELYEKSRDISYERLTFVDHNFNERISSLLKSFASEHTKILIVGNEASLWTKINASAKYEVEHILQELMINMKKHSGATNVVIRFKVLMNFIHIYYMDNGKGFPKETRFKNGLLNTGNRINNIKGNINFDTDLEEGLKINISFPIA